MWSAAGSTGQFDWHQVAGRLPREVQFPPELTVQLSGVASG